MEEYYNYEPEEVYEEPFEENGLEDFKETNPDLELLKLENSRLVIKDNREIIVPGNIRFISDWKDYSLSWFQFPHILDKKIPGCGYTEYCIRTYLPIILCSPRKILLENKEEQHIGDVFYFKNELDTDLEMDKDLTKVDKSFNNSKDEDKNNDLKTRRQEAYMKLREDLLRYVYSRSVFEGTHPKILVTYDSFRLVKEILTMEGIFEYFYVVVDEFQSIFTDSRFKSNTELEFVNELKDVKRVCYVSATPMIDGYLKQIDDFANLPYYEFNWEQENPSRVIKPDLKVRIISSITTRAKEIIQTYKEKKFETSVGRDESGNINIIESREAVFYVNSVNNITTIIKNALLTPEECNILCANTETNVNKIKKKLGKEFSIGRVPLKGESHKMFTFCTRTVYLGADFYSTNARSFILSDANVDCLAVDISLDLPQILGRQRDLSNPWKNRAEFYYKTLGKNKGKSKEEFNELIKSKVRKTKDLLDAYKTCAESGKHTLAETYQYVAKNANYRDNYVAVNKHSGTDLKPEFNGLVVVAEQRAFDIQQIDYKNRFSVFNTISEEGLVEESTTNKINSFLSRFNSLLLFREKMKLVCETELTEQERGIILDQIPLTYKNYYQALGPGRCKALSYDVTYIEREYSDLQFNLEDLEYEIYKYFSEGLRYSKSDAKEILGKIYKSLGYNKTPKANDLEKYFEIKECKILNSETGKRDMAFELLKKKEGL